MSHFWIKLIASGCFLGYSPLISGTVGSLGGLFLYIAWILCGLNWFFYGLFVLILLGLGTWVSTRFESDRFCPISDFRYLQTFSSKTM